MAEKVPSGSSVVYTNVQGQPPPSQPYPGRGLFRSVMKEVNAVGNWIGRGIDNIGNKINEAVDTSSSSYILSAFQTGNVIQLMSWSSGQLLQILTGPSGQLVLDGNGPLDPYAFNTAWTVVNEGNNQVRLHNNNNYLTVVNGHTTLVTMPVGVMHGIETKWKFRMMQKFVVLESMKERGCHIGILPNGQLKPARACGRDQDAQFAIMVLSLLYPREAEAAAPVKK